MPTNRFQSDFEFDDDPRRQQEMNRRIHRRLDPRDTVDPVARAQSAEQIRRGIAAPVPVGPGFESPPESRAPPGERTPFALDAGEERGGPSTGGFGFEPMPDDARAFLLSLIGGGLGTTPPTIISQPDSLGRIQALIQAMAGGGDRRILDQFTANLLRGE